MSREPVYAGLDARFDTEVYPRSVSFTDVTAEPPPVTAIVDGKGVPGWGLPMNSPSEIPVTLTLAPGPPVQVTVPEPGVHVTAATATTPEAHSAKSTASPAGTRTRFRGNIPDLIRWPA